MSGVFGGGGAKRQAEAAAEQSRAQAAELAIHRDRSDAEAKAQRAKAQSALIRARRARGTGFFESDTSSVLGAQGRVL